MSRPTKGWKKRAPKLTTARRRKLYQCGKGCFLVPGREGDRPRYPICPTGSCTPTCQGTLAAYKRARQQHAQAVARKAVAKGKRMGCGWAKAH
jgi:hypothetical protein